MLVKKVQSANIQAYEIMRNMIIQGTLPPGTKLVEEKLAMELGVSRTPIRDSLRKLEKDGLVKDKMVVEPTEKDFREIYKIRMLLEGEAARHAALNLTEEFKIFLENNMEICANGSKQEVLEASTTFHDRIVEFSGNDMMIEIIDRMRTLSLVARQKIFSHHLSDVVHDHKEICTAIIQGDAETAERLMKEHLVHDLEIFLQ